MPFKSKATEREYRAKYQKGLRTGERAREPETLADALKELRALVQQ